MRSIIIIAKVLVAIMLLLAVAPLPLDYYMVLRVVVFISCLSLTIYEWDDDFNFWIISFLISGILFNPLFPIYFYHKVYWMPIDILVGLLFLGSAIKDLRIKKKL